MAINLPFPNMDFVPLDILTAAEMNQMVANDAYLANMWATTDTNAIIQARHLGSDFSYSTTEKDTGRKWIDDKTIYRKTITGTTPTTTTTQTLANQFPGINKLINLESAIDAPDSTQMRPAGAPNYTPADSHYTYFRIEKGTGTVYVNSTGTANAGAAFRLTAYYTKS